MGLKDNEEDCENFESELCQKFYTTKLIDIPKYIYTKAIINSYSSQKCRGGFNEFIKETNNDHKQFFDVAAKDKNFSEQERKAFEEFLKAEAEEITKYQ
ncbi:hypothetical protein PIROE2DRAFT_4422 [Piromyces sp. E2]|nr:hypothetical protein PIROE2DRAFT_4422 [Piromyces sp. E2]|eukprot:OUM68002.1 hypothetical protein PIROE2DRAFT_4422 [Piromyces sp. E2]